MHVSDLSRTERFSQGTMRRTAYVKLAHLAVMDMADRIRTARAKLGLGQRALANKLGVSPSAVAQWESGVTKPSLTNRGKLASELGIKFSELLPEASAIGALTVTEPATVLIVQRLLELPQQIREALLLQVDAVHSSLLEPRSANQRSGTREKKPG